MKSFEEGLREDNLSLIEGYLENCTYQEWRLLVDKMEKYFLKDKTCYECRHCQMVYAGSNDKPDRLYCEVEMDHFWSDSDTFYKCCENFEED